MRRRNFLGMAPAIAAGSLWGASRLSAGLANDRITVCVMGVRGRGSRLLKTFAALPDVDVKYVCDLDLGVLKSRVADAESITG